MTLKPPTRSLPKVVVKEWPEPNAETIKMVLRSFDLMRIQPTKQESKHD